MKRKTLLAWLGIGGYVLMILIGIWSVQRLFGPRGSMTMTDEKVVLTISRQLGVENALTGHAEVVEQTYSPARDGHLIARLKLDEEAFAQVRNLDSWNVSQLPEKVIERIAGWSNSIPEVVPIVEYARSCNVHKWQMEDNSPESRELWNIRVIMLDEEQQMLYYYRMDM